MEVFIGRLAVRYIHVNSVNRKYPLVLHLEIIGIVQVGRERIIGIDIEYALRRHKCRDGVVNSYLMGDRPTFLFIHFKGHGVCTGVSEDVRRCSKCRRTAVSERPFPLFARRRLIGKYHRLTCTWLGGRIGKFYCVLFTRYQRTTKSQ